MSYYITIHHGSGVDESPGNLWVNLSFTIKEHFYLRTDGALICYMMERIREKKFKLTSEPWDRRSRWCISIPVSKMHETKDGAAADALQLAEWYRVQILNGNATINRELLFDRKPFYDGKECCRGNVCDLILHPEWWLPDPSSDASSDP
ncbi:hypothetical protein N7517_001984 [Penicillium concentricum]|uniref:Uncharacterized protein n=1 Tax=Penicillium concentricum TaxID=293559 RepID=A0A9W9SWT9_9EURO|nr:uncharacterized protein N7517_001984 [Penicillium concentricum]KAJ5384073.1 hypothetical protein N7517_001984 [Penicillium concentricum]